MRTIITIILAAMALMLSSCATVMNFDNNKSFRMGFDVVTEKPDPITVTVDGKEARFYRLYEGNNYYVDRVVVKKAKKHLQVTITQNGATKARKVYGEKAKGLFWCSGLFVLIDHATGTLRQYPAVVFEDTPDQASSN